MHLERFKAQINNLQRANRYNVSFFGTGKLNGGLAIRGLKCESAALPGQGFFAVEDSEYGPKRAIPHKPQYDAFDCSFYITNDFEDRQLIEMWMQSVNGFKSGGFHSRFHDDYKGIIYLEALSNSNKVNYKCCMVDAFPMQLGVINFGYANSDIQKFNCQFRYRYWESQFMNGKQDGLITGFMAKHLDKLESKVRGKIEDAIF